MSTQHIGFGVHFEMTENAATQRLQNITQRASDPRPALEAIGDRLALSERDLFASQGRGAWPPLSPAYGAWKAKRYPGAPVLVRSGDLRSSLTHRPFGVDVVDMRQAVWGTAVDYAGFHDTGTNRMPQRRPLVVDDAERREWARVMARWIAAGHVGG